MDKIERLTKIVWEVLQRIENTPTVSVGVSNRHVHLCQEDVETLFGKGYQLTLMKELMQPGEFACHETVNISGKKGTIEKVRVLGPTRKNTQVEVSFTDSVKLGVSAAVSESGNLTNAGFITIENPLTGAKVEKKCAIAALRHIHVPPDFAEKFHLNDRQMVSVEFDGERGIVFHKVLLRVSPNFRLEMHLDTDEANAGGIVNGTVGRIII